MLNWYFEHELTMTLIFWIYYKSSQKKKNTIQVVKVFMYIYMIQTTFLIARHQKKKTQCILFKCNYMLKYSLRTWNLGHSYENKYYISYYNLTDF